MFLYKSYLFHFISNIVVYLLLTIITWGNSTLFTCVFILGIIGELLMLISFILNKNNYYD